MNTRYEKLQSILDAPVHEYADLFPMMAEMELRDGSRYKECGPLVQLADDIRVNGLHQPIVMYKVIDPETGEIVTQILDGRNRRAALKILDTMGQAPDEVPVQDYEGDDPLGFVISLNVTRRHLDRWQLVEVGYVLAGPIAERAAARMKAGTLSEIRTGRTQDLVAETLGGISGDTLAAGWKMMERSPELWAATKRTKSGINTAARKMALPGIGSAAHASTDTAWIAAQEDPKDHPVLIEADKIHDRLSKLLSGLRSRGGREWRPGDPDEASKRAEYEARPTAVEKLPEDVRYELGLILAKISAIAELDSLTVGALAA